MNESLNSLIMSIRTQTADNRTSPMTFEIVTVDLYEILNLLVAITTMLIAISGIVVNALNIKTFLMMGIEDGVTVTFISLSISDFCYTLVTFIQTVSAILASVETKYGLWFRIQPFAITFFSANVGVVVYMVTTLTTTYLATVRCLCVAKPLHFKNMFTRRKSTVILASFPVMAIVSQVAVFVHMGITTRFDPRVNQTRLVLWLSDDRERIKDIVRVIFDTYLSLVSQIVVVVCVGVMISKLRQSVKFRQKQEAVAETKDDGGKGLTGKERSVVIQVVFISTVYIICNLCKMTNAFFTLVDSKFDMGKEYQYFYIIMSSCRTAFDCINSSVSFYVYFIFNSKFRSLCLIFRKRY